MGRLWVAVCGCDALGTLKQQVAIGGGGDRIHSMSFGDKGGMQRASSGQVLIRWVDRVAS